jgi:hypothetical protein
VGLRRASHSGLVLKATSGPSGQDLQASGSRFLSVLSARRERLGLGGNAEGLGHERE